MQNYKNSHIKKNGQICLIYNYHNLIIPTTTEPVN